MTESSKDEPLAAILERLKAQQRAKDLAQLEELRKKQTDETLNDEQRAKLEEQIHQLNERINSAHQKSTTRGGWGQTVINKPIGGSGFGDGGQSR